MYRLAITPHEPAHPFPTPTQTPPHSYLPFAPVIEDTHPRFSWVLQHADRGTVQRSYRIIVNASASRALVWDSGVVTSPSTIGVAYAGSPLVSNTWYSWTVVWTDGAGAAAPPASPAFFATGLLTQAEWAGSSWIGCTQPARTNGGPNQVRGVFTLALPAGVTITQARAYVTGLGYYRGFVNGERLGTNLHLDPAWTIPSTRVLYSAFDVAAALNPRGPNVLAAYLGNGWEDVQPNGFNGTGNDVAGGQYAKDVAAAVGAELVARGAVTAAQVADAAARLDWSSHVDPTTGEFIMPGADVDALTANWTSVAAVLTATRTEGGLHGLLAAAKRRAGLLPRDLADRLQWDSAAAVRKFRAQVGGDGGGGVWVAWVCGL